MASIDSLPAPIGIASLTKPAAVHAAPASGDPGRHDIAFTGSGSEYFRIWIVNLLLILVTFTLYYPWAKVRKLRYFHANTQVAGHAFDFHGEPAKMLRGYLFVAALFGAYSAASQFSPVAGFFALVILASIWPVLFRGSLRFRMAQTSWRALRFGFDGSTAGAYRAMLPAFVPALLFFALIAWLETQADTEAEVPEGAQEVSLFMAFAPLLVMLVVFAFVPLMWWGIKRYQHGHWRLGGLRTSFDAGPGAFYKVFAKTAGIGIVASAAGGVLVSIVVAAGAFAAMGGDGKRAAVGMVLGMVAGIAMYGLLILLVQPYFQSRMQNLLWSRTLAPGLRFESALRFQPLFKLTVKNWLLVLCTLGLYWPFAAVALAKLRLESVTLVTEDSLDAIVGERRAPMKDAAGDAAADVFDLDVGL